MKQKRFISILKFPSQFGPLHRLLDSDILFPVDCVNPADTEKLTPLASVS